MRHPSRRNDLIEIFTKSLLSPTEHSFSLLPFRTCRLYQIHLHLVPRRLFRTRGRVLGHSKMLTVPYCCYLLSVATCRDQAGVIAKEVIATPDTSSVRRIPMLYGYRIYWNGHFFYIQLFKKVSCFQLMSSPHTYETQSILAEKFLETQKRVREFSCSRLFKTPSRYYQSRSDIYGR